jgi:hypothetical protein
MSLDYHLVDPLGDDEKDEQQSGTPASAPRQVKVSFI